MDLGLGIGKSEEIRVKRLLKGPGMSKRVDPWTPCDFADIQLGCDTWQNRLRIIVRLTILGLMMIYKGGVRLWLRIGYGILVICCCMEESVDLLLMVVVLVEGDGVEMVVVVDGGDEFY
ncbi:hypothetical protein QVD17_11757 [Tagetes erecta]|uniref:Uncharacterized protein n=1 Tax=Tagetes erecta TaxID=13708 RepID=A0AAD8KYQ7_TARER|nr:hypothetical protein QVD17_11757 [Tagetes erecta]